MSEKRVIAYTISDDYEKLRGTVRSLWAHKQNAPFDEVSIKTAPNPKPGYKGLFYINITGPSEELVKEIKPSYIDIGKYPQFESYADNDINELIKTMVYSKKIDPKDIAQSLGVTVSEVMIWSYYVNY
jgi:hypothetical protein